MIDVILVGLISIGVFALFVFVAVRESAINKKLKTYERSFDIINKEIFALKKELKNKDTNTIAQHDEKFATAEEFEEFTNIIISKLRDLQNDSSSFKQSVYEKFKDAEEKEQASHNTTSLPLSASIADEHKIIQLFESGYTLEDIARQLRVHVGEIEFVLKLNNVKTRSLF
jgi:GTPase involved in cell partitioning and DNA repair